MSSMGLVGLEAVMVPEARMAARSTRARPVPTQTERPFDIDEIFFSTTDRKGLIRSGNRVFARVSGYSRAKLVGRPHNVVRHPDMPHAIFKVFWDELEAGRPIAAYVKNMAKDGSYYWVMATAVPCNGGYLSVRIKPSSSYFATTWALYAELLAIEQELEAGDTSRRQQAIEASSAHLLERLREAGFDNYAAFQRAALMAELKERARLIEQGTRQCQAVPPPGADPALVGVLQACCELDTFLETLAGRLSARSVANSDGSRGQRSTTYSLASSGGPSRVSRRNRRFCAPPTMRDHATTRTPSS